jgi:ligand-binding SRPBCC domain-containing protein
MSKIYQFNQVQTIQSDISTVWNFFSSPANLKKITPPDMDFRIVDPGGQGEIANGQIIRYTVSPFPFIRVTSVTEIDGVEHQRCFEDRQKKGPFSLWHHKHEFVPIDHGVQMTDQVRYSVPLGLLGRLANRLMVEKRLRHIFDFRRKQIESLFPPQTL